MPIVRFEETPHFSLLVFEITETAQELHQNLVASNEEWADFDNISHPQKQLEWLASRQALQQLVTKKGLIYSGLYKNKHGKPHLIGHNGVHISLTHTKRFVGVVFSDKNEVGIDMEQNHEKIIRIKNKFLNDHELLKANDSVEKLCFFWCAKEALYKLWGQKNLSFKNGIKVENKTYGQILIENNWQKQELFKFNIADYQGVVAF